MKFEQVRKVEMLISMLLYLIATCFYGEMGFVKPPTSQVSPEMFVPKLSGQGAIAELIVLLSAIILSYYSISFFSLFFFYFNYLFLKSI